jgi:hypothetical protein
MENYTPLMVFAGLGLGVFIGGLLWNAFRRSSYYPKSKFDSENHQDRKSKHVSVL